MSEDTKKKVKLGFLGKLAAKSKKQNEDKPKDKSYSWFSKSKAKQAERKK